MDYVIHALRSNPELAIFLTLALGFLIGRLKIGSFSLGIVVGTLLAGVVVGQVGVQVPGAVKAVFFSLFLFTTGYKVGPQFFRGLSRDALPQVLLTLVVCVTCLGSAVACAKVMGYDIGTTAGLLAGAFSESTVIGTAGEAIQKLSLADAQKAVLLSNIPVAYAATYLIGTATLVWFLPTIGPTLMGVSLKDEGLKAQAVSAGNADWGLNAFSAAHFFDLRAYRLTNPRLANKSVAELEAMPQDTRIFVVRLRRSGILIDTTPTTIVLLDDVVAVLARQETHIARGDVIGPEVDDRPLVDVPIDMVDVIVTRRALVGRTLQELAAQDFARGVYLRKLTRAGQDIPIVPTTTIDRGDVLRLCGIQTEVERAGRALGYPDRMTTATDMVFVGTGIVLGGLIGLWSVTIAGVPLTLTASGGALVMGLVFGWLRSVYPIFGRIPEPAVWIFDTVGLCIFIGVVGLSAGPSFISGLKASGPSLIVAGLVTALLPHVVGILFGRYVLKMNPLIVLGACAGAGTITAALRAIQDAAKSNVPALGYTVPYAIGNIVLTAWGPVIVALMTL